MSIEVRPASGRFTTRAEGRTTHHSFAFGAHYDPRNVGFARMLAHNDEHLPPRTGYPDHPHVDTEIVTWVLSGALRHTDSSGHSGLVVPGQVQLLSAGSGVVHSEVADSSEETRFVQTWIRPDASGLVPEYAQADVEPAPGLTPVVGGEGAVGIHSRGTTMYVGHLAPGSRTPLPDVPLLHVFVIAGAVLLGDHYLGPDDSARITSQGGRAVQVPSDQGEPAELMVWAFSQ